MFPRTVTGVPTKLKIHTEDFCAKRNSWLSRLGIIFVVKHIFCLQTACKMITSFSSLNAFEGKLTQCY